MAFYLFYFGAFFYTLNLFVLLFSILGIAIHHYIVLNEEKFLEKEFGNEYQEYKNRVRRYL
jgi:protein-S-isoprenylcysteine O-methyltransferase Ste14